MKGEEDNDVLASAPPPLGPYRSRLVLLVPGFRGVAVVDFCVDDPPSDEPMSRSWRLGRPSSHWLTCENSCSGTEISNSNSTSTSDNNNNDSNRYDQSPRHGALSRKHVDVGIEKQLKVHARITAVGVLPGKNKGQRQKRLSGCSYT